MSDANGIPKKKQAKSTPAWVVTFADLMSLLMCFFVLLLSFSEMDLQRFKQVAGSMERAFGVQRQIRTHDIPRGTSIIAQEFSPGRPRPTPINEVRQFTATELEDLLKIEQKKIQETGDRAKEIAKEMEDDIQAGLIEIEAKENRIVIRIMEKSSFQSGSAILRAGFIPILQKIGKILAITPGKITVAGYTDDVPIKTDVFRSNWELSVIRAVSVAEELLKDKNLEPARFVLHGYGATRPIAPNDTSENRAKNRRVELVILQGKELEEDDEVIKIDKDADTQLLPNIEEIETIEPTFPPSTEITFDDAGTYLEEGELGVFEEEVLYNYELDETVVPPKEEPEKQDESKLLEVEEKPDDLGLFKEKPKVQQVEEQKTVDKIVTDDLDVFKEATKSEVDADTKQIVKEPTAESKGDDLGLFKEEQSQIIEKEKSDKVFEKSSKTQQQTPESVTQKKQTDDLGLFKEDKQDIDETEKVGKDNGDGKYKFTESNSTDGLGLFKEVDSQQVENPDELGIFTGEDEPQAHPDDLGVLPKEERESTPITDDLGTFKEKQEPQKPQAVIEFDKD